ncbi:MAG: 23S rRNA (pseudouridine(1915)-N(3))-methyltransferase RlmH [Pyrinomonadaceae bacterium]
MKFRFIWVGKTRDKNWRELQDDYLQRLSHFVKCEIVEVRDSSGITACETTGNRILEKVNQNAFVCLLDVGGKIVTSQDLAAQVEKWQNTGLKDIAFIIGGATGVSSQVAARADFKVSLSFLTFTHEMVRVVLIEQLYRAFTIIKGFPYHK